MSKEAALRQLDRDLPRIQVFNPRFLARMKAKKKGYYVPPEEEEEQEPSREKRWVNHVKEHAKEIDRRAAAIHEQTRNLKLDPRDIGRPISAILADVAKNTGVSVQDIRGEARHKLPVAARHQVIARLYLTYPKMPFSVLGKGIGGRDHSTIIAALLKSGHYVRHQNQKSRRYLNNQNFKIASWELDK